MEQNVLICPCINLYRKPLFNYLRGLFLSHLAAASMTCCCASLLISPFPGARPMDSCKMIPGLGRSADV